MKSKEAFKNKIKIASSVDISKNGKKQKYLLVARSLLTAQSNVIYYRLQRYTPCKSQADRNRFPEFIELTITEPTAR